MTAFRRYWSGLAAVAFCAAALGACVEATGPAPLTLAPKPGSNLLTVGYEITSDAKIVWPSELDDQDTINMIIDTLPLPIPITDTARYNRIFRPNVLAIRNVRNGSPAGTSFYSFEPNGDIAQYLTPHSFGGGAVTVPEQWLVYPFGSKVPSTITMIDTTLSDGNNGTISYKETSKMIYEGTETVLLGRLGLSSLQATRVKTIRDVITIFKDKNQNVRQTQQHSESVLWYSPKLGMIIKGETMNSRDEGTGNGLQHVSGEGWVLSSYTLAGAQ